MSGFCTLILPNYVFTTVLALMCPYFFQTVELILKFLWGFYIHHDIHQNETENPAQYNNEACVRTSHIDHVL